jgi:hypothetical protein
MILIYFMEMSNLTLSFFSQITINSSVCTSRTQYEASRMSSYDTPRPSIRVSDTQAPAPERPELTRREIQLRNTYNLSLIRRVFGR